MMKKRTGPEWTNPNTELVSACCESHHDEMFSYDWDFGQGICSSCGDHASFNEGEYDAD